MRGKRVKAHRRALAVANIQLAAAVDGNRDVALLYHNVAMVYMWQTFWQGIALASLLAYLDARRGAHDGPMAIVPWASVERAVWFWPSDVVI